MDADQYNNSPVAIDAQAVELEHVRLNKFVAVDVIDLLANHDNAPPPADDGGVLEEIVVTNASFSGINGTYIRDGQLDYVSKYIKTMSDGTQYEIYRRRDKGGTRRWLISSLVVEKNELGDDGNHAWWHDDYYTADHSMQESVDPNIPPRTGWMPTNRAKIHGGGYPAVSPSLFDLVAQPLEVGGIPLTQITQGRSDNCAICHETFFEGEYCSNLSCSHLLHRRCLGDLLMRKNYRCPVCRQSHF